MDTVVEEQPLDTNISSINTQIHNEKWSLCINTSVCREDLKMEHKSLHACIIFYYSLEV